MKTDKKKTKKIKDEKENYDLSFQKGSQKNWLYSDVVKEHFFKPKNFLSEKEEKKLKYNGLGMVGSPACGDMMKFWIYVDPKTEKIKECKWRTFGCASAIASTSMLSLMISENGGMNLKKALQIKPQDILKRLGGLPAQKIHCSVLGDKALRSAINDYFRRTGQTDKISAEGAKVVDGELGITDKDIEAAVLNGAKTIRDLQKATKIGMGNNKDCLLEAGELLRFYLEKHEIIGK